MSTSAIRGLTSITVPCRNQLSFTQQCLAALKDHTRPAWELIVIDNGSNDGTAGYLAGVRDMAAMPGTVVTNTRNVGFPAAINQGLRLARGEYLVLMNNDVVVTDAWLDQLIGLVNAKRGLDAERKGPRGTHRLTREGDLRSIPVRGRETLAQRRRRLVLAMTAALTAPGRLILKSVSAMPLGPPPLAPPSQGGER
jgi:glycosyltransferase involved in cell wall biosynthesis